MAELVDALVSNTNVFGLAGSIPALGTPRKTSDSKGLLTLDPYFFGLATPKATANGADPMKKNRPLYRKSHVVIPGLASKDQRWFIKYWPFSEHLNRHVAKKSYKNIPLVGSLKQRLARVTLVCLALDLELENGAVLKREKVEVFGYPMNQAIIDYKLAKENLRPKSQKGISDSMIKFLRYLVKAKLVDTSLQNFTPLNALGYKDYLLHDGLSKRSVYNYITYISSMFNHFIERMPDLMLENPFRRIKRERGGAGRNSAYVKEQVEELMEYQKDYPDIDFMAKWMYYSLMRTNEMVNLQVKHIDQIHQGQIYVSKESSKNGHERHIHIPPALKKLIDQYEIKKYPAEYYVFALPGERKGKRKLIMPGPDIYRSASLGERYRINILSKLKYSTDYTLYSWKHTGVVLAKLAGISDADIMQQTGHRDYGSYKQYLKSLGLFSSGAYARDIPEI